MYILVIFKNHILYFTGFEFNLTAYLEGLQSPLPRLSLNLGVLNLWWGHNSHTVFMYIMFKICISTYVDRNWLHVRKSIKPSTKSVHSMIPMVGPSAGCGQNWSCSVNVYNVWKYSLSLLTRVETDFMLRKTIIVFLN